MGGSHGPVIPGAAGPSFGYGARRPIEFRRRASGCVLVALLLAGTATAQITVNSKTGAVTNNSTGKTVNQVDPRYQQIKPTSVPLTKSELDAKTRLELIRCCNRSRGLPCVRFREATRA
jgi:hypothetical protein